MMELAGDDFSGLEYTIETEQGELPDPCGRIYTGHERWGDLKAALRPVRCRFPEETYDWEMDQPLKHPYDETILYRLHVRGFTRHTSSRHRGAGNVPCADGENSLFKGMGTQQ